MTRSHGRAASLRQLRVGEEIRHLLAAMMAEGDLRDPELQGITFTVTEVSISPDFANATVYVTPFLTKNATGKIGTGKTAVQILTDNLPPHQRAEAIYNQTRPALMRAAPFLRSQLARQLKVRLTPRLSFAFDTAFDYANKITQLFDSEHVAQDLRQSAQATLQEQSQVS